MENEDVSWQDLVHQHVRTFGTFAMVGNSTEAIRTLETIEEIVRAAVNLDELPKSAHLDVRALADRVHPHIVLRRQTRASAIVDLALREAGILPRDAAVLRIAAA